MDATPILADIATYSLTDHMYHCGPGTGATYADAVADAMMLGAFLAPVTCDAAPDGWNGRCLGCDADFTPDLDPYICNSCVCEAYEGGGPADGPQEDEGEGDPTPPPDIYGALPREARQEIDLLCACASGEHIRDWAMVDALAAHVRRTMAEVLR